MDFNESQEELEAKLTEYNQQLDSVLELLAQDPKNEELIVLERDLREVISLTKDLVKYKQSNEELLQQANIQIDDSKPADVGTSIFLGRTCVVLYNGKQKYGEVVEVKGDQPADLTIIELLGSRERCGLALKDLRLLEPPPPDQCKTGELVQALYAEDGRWYDCIINRQTENGYIITYKDYNTSEEIQRDRIRLKTRSERSKEVKEIVTPAGYVIPENLIIKKTDNEKDKMRKRKLVQSLKKQQKNERLNEEANKRANSWRKFQEKSGSKNKAGYMTGKREGSIFNSSDLNTAPTLGVDSTMYNTFVPRRKFDYTGEF